MKSSEDIVSGHQLHPRRFEDNSYVYPVLSRRSGGISIGINLNPDKICNMDCVYCQVDRHVPPTRRSVDLEQLSAELRALTEDTLSGALFEHPRFSDTPPELRRLNDFALSGDGEPTTFKPFAAAIRPLVALKTELGLEQVRIVLITDSGCLHHDHVKEGLKLMDAHNGEIWAKLDAGTPDYYQRVNRTKIPFDRVLKNIRSTAQERAIVIQSLFMRLDAQGPSDAEIEAFIERLREIEGVGELKEVHLYTVARPPAEAWVGALHDAELDSIAARVRPSIAAPVRVFYGG